MVDGCVLAKTEVPDSTQPKNKIKSPLLQKEKIQRP